MDRVGHDERKHRLSTTALPFMEEQRLLTGEDRDAREHTDERQRSRLLEDSDSILRTRRSESEASKEEPEEESEERRIDEPRNEDVLLSSQVPTRTISTPSIPNDPETHLNDRLRMTGNATMKGEADSDAGAMACCDDTSRDFLRSFAL